MWTFITPELAVPDVAEAQRWYHEVLDFEIGFRFGERYGAVYSGKTEIFFRRSEHPEPSVCCCVRVPDADAAFALYRERGAKISAPLENQPWGMREFAIVDPWGHRFRIGHSTRR